MCGILGVNAQAYPEETFLKGLKRIQHRGPDNMGHEKIKDVILGHTRLSIIDLSPKSNQPLWDVNRQVCITFNGEIYNYKALKADLLQRGFAFSTDGDAEVLLNLYLQGEPDWLNKLKGIFAFAIYDARTEEMLLVRDPFGVKPLYYTQNQRGFFFSSEIKALLAFPEVSRTLNHDAVFRTVTFLWSPGPETILSDVLKLEPGNLLVIKNGKVASQEVYWHWPKYSPQPLTVESAIKLNRQALADSVKAQSVSDVPIGSFLSGGLDSSLIVALAKEQGLDDLQCFTIQSETNDEGFVDDLPYAKRVAEKLSLPLHIVMASPDILSSLQKMLYHMDEPQADPAPLNVMLISELAREKGIKVLFSGAGGDDLYTGYRRHVAVKFEKYWQWLPTIARKFLEYCANKLPARIPLLRRIKKAFAYASLNENERTLSYFYWLDPKIVRSLFSDKAAKALSVNPMQHILDELKAKEPLNSLEKMLYLERRYFLIDHNLNYTDKMSMATGVEVRVPFLEKTVADAVAITPTDFKQKNKTGKWILKKVAEGHLEKDIIYRSKSGFGAPLRQWLNHDLKGLVDTLLSEEKIEKRGLFNYQQVQKLITADRLGKADYSYPIFALLCIELWCQIFIADTQTG